jgi:plastocyanin
MRCAYASGRLVAALMASMLCTLLAPGAVHADAPREVSIEALRFTPQTMEARVGEVIVWRNHDPFPHTVNADSKEFASGEIAAEGAWRMQLSRKGVYPYRCALHPTMRGTLIVK